MLLVGGIDFAMLSICPLVYECFMEGTTSFHISVVCAGML